MDTLCIQQKFDESALCAQQIDVAMEIKFRSRYMMFVYHCNINKPEYHTELYLACLFYLPRHNNTRSLEMTRHG